MLLMYYLNDSGEKIYTLQVRVINGLNLICNSCLQSLGLEVNVTTKAFQVNVLYVSKKEKIFQIVISSVRV